jgi:hypothetical protein
VIRDGFGESTKIEIFRGFGFVSHGEEVAN